MTVFVNNKKKLDFSGLLFFQLRIHVASITNSRNSTIFDYCIPGFIAHEAWIKVFGFTMENKIRWKNLVDISGVASDVLITAL